MVQTTKPQTSLGNAEFQTMIKHDSGQFLVFTAEAGEGIEVRYQDGTIWLKQKLMAQLFDVDVRTISEHLGNIFVSGELQENSVIRKFRITASDGKSYVTKHYNTDRRSNYWNFFNSSPERPSPGRAANSALQPGCDYLGGLPHEFHSRHPVLSVGDRVCPKHQLSVRL